MTKTTALFAALLGTALLPGLAPAQIKKSGGGYLLRLKFTQGQTIRHRVSTTVTGLPSMGGSSSVIKNGVMKLTGTMTEVVQSVTGNVATISSTVGPFSVPGNPTPLAPAKTVTARVNELGEPVGGSQAGGLGARFPKGVLKVGQAWSAAVPSTGMSSAGSPTAKFTFQGIKKVNGKDLAVIAVTVVPTAQFKSGKGTMYFQPSNGMLSSGTLNFEMNNPQSGATSPIKVAVQISPA